MKIFRSESLVDYSTYTFNYAIYCLKEKQQELPEIYAKGFLPYSNDPDLDREVYYLARSLRVDLQGFTDSSENRRVNKKIAEMDPSFEVIPATDFDMTEPSFVKFCKDFADQRFSEPVSEKRLAYIFNNRSVSHLFRFHLIGSEVG